MNTEKESIYKGVNEYKFPIDIVKWGIKKGEVAIEEQGGSYSIDNFIIPKEVIEAIDFYGNREIHLRRAFNSARENILVLKYETFENYLTSKSGT